MAAHVPGFVGNVEGHDIPEGTVDVVVTDGFTGNVALKLMEGLSKVLLGQFKDAMLSSPVIKVAAAVLRPSLASLKDRLDPELYGAAPLLGVNGLALIGHGSSGPRAVASALRVGAQAVRGGLVERIAESLRG
jgi:glycerol-3-phosphate acyltransferase PlsX